MSTPNDNGGDCSLQQRVRRAYEPDAEAARLAPACVCNIASRIMWLRQKLAEFDADTQRKLKPFIAPLPFEAELLSGRMEAVDAAMKKIGERELAGSPNARGAGARDNNQPNETDGNSTK